jgi:hypothetical protein
MIFIKVSQYRVSAKDPATSRRPYLMGYHNHHITIVPFPLPIDCVVVHHSPSFVDCRVYIAFSGEAIAYVDQSS